MPTPPSLPQPPPTVPSPSLFDLPDASLPQAANYHENDGGFPYTTEEDAPYWEAPAPIAIATNKLLEETPINSTDELIHLLEVWLRHLGWLWIAEYLAASWQDEPLNLRLFEKLYEGKRGISVGGWAHLGSTIAQSFATRGHTPRTPALASFAYGSRTERHSRLSRLLRYRNSFAHGSFSAIIQDIMEHRRLLWELVAPMDALRKSPIVFWDQVAQVWRKASGTWSPYTDHIPLHPQEGAIWQLCPGEALDLTHICQVRALPAPGQLVSEQAPTDKGSPRRQHWQLCYLSPHSADRAMREQLFTRQPHTQAHFFQFQAMRQGKLDFTTSFADEALPPLPAKEWQSLQAKLQKELDERLPTRPKVVALLGYPGSGKSGVLAQADTLFQGFTHTLLYRMHYRGVTTSAATCARYLLRSLAMICEEPSWREGLEDVTALPAKLTACLKALPLKRPDARILVGIDQFHLAYEPYQSESNSIYELLVGLEGASSEHIALLIAARPGYRDDLMGDTFLSLPIAAYENEKKYDGLLDQLGLELRESSQGHSAAEVTFRRTLLFLLGCAPHPLSPFDLCEVFERLQQQMPARYGHVRVFTPHVERSLWELRPVLKWSRIPATSQHDRERVVYAPFCAQFGDWLQRELGPGG